MPAAVCPLAGVDLAAEDDEAAARAPQRERAPCRLPVLRLGALVRVGSGFKALGAGVRALLGALWPRQVRL